MRRYQKVQLWIFSQNKEHQQDFSFLLLKMRADRGGHWQPVTGSVDEAEEIHAAALREGREESGLTLIPERLIDLKHQFQFKSQWGQATEFAFAISVDHASPVRLDPHEHVAFEWVNAAEALRRLSFDSNRAVLQLLLKHLKSA